MYVNGSAVAFTVHNTNSADATGMTVTAPLSIGFSKLGNSDYLDGYIRNVAIYKTRLTSGQVTTNYNSGCMRDPSSINGLVFFSRLNEGSGTQITDVSPSNIMLTATQGDWKLKSIPGAACLTTNELAQQVFCNADGYRFGFNGQERDNELKGEGNSYDFGARIYDSRLGRNLSMDKMLDVAYPFLTPYCGLGNRPISAIDYNGDLIIIINGYWPGNRNAPNIKLPTYWNTQMKANAARTLNDYRAIYFNGSSSAGAGAVSLLAKKATLGIVGFGSTEYGRYNEGIEAAYQYAKFIREQLDNDPVGKLNFISHSMGGAYAAGMIDALRAMKNEDGSLMFKPEEFGDAYFLAPYQAGKIPARTIGNNYQSSHGKDFIAGSTKISGNTKYEKPDYGHWYNPLDRLGAHKNETFSDVFKSKGDKEPTQIPLPNEKDPEYNDAPTQEPHG